MKKNMKIRIMTTLMAGTFAFGFMAGPLSPSTTARGTIHVYAAEASTEKKADLTYEEARKIALADAGLEDKDVTWYETNRDFDDDRQLTIWDLGFYHGDTEYDYDINIANGEIVEKDSDIMDAEDRAENQKKAEALKEALNKNTVNKDAANKNAAAKDAKQSKKNVKELTEDKALEIALEDAGISADAANVTKNHIDHDNGVEVYDIEFTSGDKEYEYEIDVKTGAIHDKDIDSIYDD